MAGVEDLRAKLRAKLESARSTRNTRKPATPAATHSSPPTSKKHSQRPRATPVKPEHADEVMSAAPSNLRKRPRQPAVASAPASVADPRLTRALQVVAAAVTSIAPVKVEESIDDADDSDGLGDIQFNSITGIVDAGHAIADGPRSHSWASEQRVKRRKQSDAQLLKRLEKFNTQIDELRQSDRDAAESLLRARAFTNAMLRATGHTVKDNATLIKKSLKKKKSRKEKSAKEWSERLDQQKRSQKETVKRKNDAWQSKYDAGVAKARGGKRGAGGRDEAE